MKNNTIEGKYLQCTYILLLLIIMNFSRALQIKVCCGLASKRYMLSLYSVKSPLIWCGEMASPIPTITILDYFVMYFTQSREFSSRNLQIVLLFRRIFSAIVRPFLINITDPTLKKSARHENFSLERNISLITPSPHDTESFPCLNLMPKLLENVLSNLLSAKDWDKTLLWGTQHTAHENLISWDLSVAESGVTGQS